MNFLSNRSRAFKEGGVTRQPLTTRASISFNYIDRSSLDNSRSQNRRFCSSVAIKAAVASAASLACAAPIESNISIWNREEVDELGASLDFDILGLAQSMLDASVECVPDELLLKLDVPKGGRRVLSTVSERSEVLASLNDAGFSPKISPGGSLCNTLVTVSRLSRAADRNVSVALGGSSSEDALGSFFVSSLAEAGVGRFDTAAATAFDTNAPAKGTTGLVFVLPSSDGQRSFLSFFQEEQMHASSQLLTAVSKSRIIVIEGYLWCMPGAAEAIQKMVDQAKLSGTQVVLTAGDPGVVARYRDSMWSVLNSPSGRDMILFANKEEACELLGHGWTCDAMKAAGDLGSLCSIAVVTDGSNGSFVSCMGRVEAIPPSPVISDILDTCGAGDAYAGGFLYALMTGHLCCEAGQFASSVAAKVVSRHGSQLTQDEAAMLIKSLPAETLSSIEWIERLEANLLGH